MKSYVVALTASSAVRFEAGTSVALRGVRTREGAVDVKWFTRYGDEGYESPVPRELWVEVRGGAPSLEAARTEFEDAGRALTILLGLAANAPIGDAEWELAYEDTPGATSRDFAQRFVATEKGLPRSSRVLDRTLVGPVVKAIMEHSEVDRLHRAAVHYNEALKAWIPGTELRAVTHLWMAVEALTPVALRRELARRMATRQDLCSAWDIEIKRLDPEVRRRLIFRDDLETYKEALAVSDAVEHAFEPLAALHARASTLRARFARHVRASILGLAEIPDQTLDTLLADPYSVPRESFSITRILRGKLEGEGEVLAAQGQPYPFLHWTSGIEELKRIEDGSYQIRPQDDFKAALGPGISLRPITLEVWGPRQDSAKFETEDRPVVVTCPTEPTSGHDTSK